MDSESVAVSRGTGEDAPVEVPETRTRNEPDEARHRLTSEPMIAERLEFPRS
jgi:hypothetical protein